MPPFKGVVIKPNGEQRMCFEVFKTLKPDAVHKHLVRRAKVG